MGGDGDCDASPVDGRPRVDLRRRGMWVTKIPPRVIGVAFLVLMAGFLVHNLAVVVDIQNGSVCKRERSLCVHPRHIADRAWETTDIKVKTRFATAYGLRRYVSGARVSMPPELAEHLWRFERVSRLKVTISDSRFLLEPEEMDRLSAAATATLYLRKKKDKNPRARRHFYLIAEPDTADYVVAQSGTEAGAPLMFMPRARFDSVVAARQRAKATER